MSRQQSYVVHKAFDQLLIFVGLLVPNQLTLSANLLARHFDLEFVCSGLVFGLVYHVSRNYLPTSEMVTWVATYFGRRNLSQIDLILQMFVAHTILLSIPFSIALFHGYQLVHIAIKIHFNIHTDSPVE